jgi:hypothetical protein
MTRGRATARWISTAALTASLAAFALGCGGSDSDSPESGDSVDSGAPEAGRNVVRVPGRSPTDVAAAATLAAYPPEQDKVPNGFVLFPRDDWRRAVLSAQFVAAPVGASLLPTEPDFLPTAADDVVTRIRPNGFPTGPDLHALLLGEPGDDVVLAFQQQMLALTKLDKPNLAELAALLLVYRGGWAQSFSDDILVVSADDEDRPYALVAAAWSGFTGDTLAFVEGDSVPEATKAMLDQRQELRLIKPTIWLIGPPEAVSEDVASELGSYGEVKRVEGEGPVETAVEMARYRDQETGFGWGLKAPPFNVTLVNLNDWGNAVGAFQLAGSGPRGALLLTDNSEGLPDAVVEYLAEAQGPRASQGYVLGDRDSIDSSQLEELDALLDAKQPPADAKNETKQPTKATE